MWSHWKVALEKKTEGDEEGHSSHWSGGHFSQRAKQGQRPLSGSTAEPDMSLSWGRDRSNKSMDELGYLFTLMGKNETGFISHTICKI